jgi:hypothetical protein
VPKFSQQAGSGDAIGTSFFGYVPSISRFAPGQCSMRNSDPGLRGLHAVYPTHDCCDELGDRAIY